MSTVKSESNDLPKEKKERPLGRSLSLNIPLLNNLPPLKERNQKLLITPVRNYKDYLQMLSNEQNDERSDATGDDSSNAAWTIKIFLN